ncbi:MAG: hypothetical protein AAF713_05985 [Pseudomonadota bacterium]
MKRLIVASAMVVTAAFAVPATADDEMDFIEQFQSYMELSEQFLNLANRNDAAVFFAVEGIVEIHEDRGERAKAIPVLKGVLEKYPDNQAVRNIIRFKLRDLYRETGQADLALTELQVVIEENR